MSDWRPKADIETLHKRAAFFASIRAFFANREVLEVDTPCLSPDTITDVHLEAFKTMRGEYASASSQSLYLQTSPEYFMKRLLAAGSGDIYYLGKCFRNEQSSRLHLPEFTMLEWYRCGFDMQALINEMIELLNALLGLSVEQTTYQQAFLDYLEFDPLSLSENDVDTLASRYDLTDYLSNYNADNNAQTARKDALLDVLFSRYIETDISREKPVIISHFPASQASLAKLSENGKTAERFELYINGVELANGFEELTDSVQQQKRFEKDNQIRRALGKPQKTIDPNFMSALEDGLPHCAGVAMGVDRLFMLKYGIDKIQSAVPFC